MVVFCMVPPVQVGWRRCQTAVAGHGESAVRDARAGVVEHDAVRTAVGRDAPEGQPARADVDVVDPQRVPLAVGVTLVVALCTSTVPASDECVASKAFAVVVLSVSTPVNVVMPPPLFSRKTPRFAAPWVIGPFIDTVAVLALT